MGSEIMKTNSHIDEAQHLIAALAADYIAVYIIEPEKDTAAVVMLGAGITDKVGSIPESFCYSEKFRDYAEAHIEPVDRENFLNVVMPDALIKSFADGREKLELNYRVLGSGKHYSGLFIRTSKLGEPLRLIVGFRNTEDVINIQKQTRAEGVYSAYSALSDAYLSMHRVNVKKNTYSEIKTTEAILKYTLPDSNSFDRNVLSIIKGLAREESYNSALDFLDLKTLDERMQGKRHISTRFEGRIAGTCRFHFFKEDTDEDGRLLHVIFAVEVVDEDRYQSVFDVLARGFQNVFWIDPENSTARILKLDGYVTKGLNKDNLELFSYHEMLKRYIEDRVYPEDQEPLYDKLNAQRLREVFARHDEYIGNYRVLDDGEIHYYQYSLNRVKGTNFIVAGFQNIDTIIEEHSRAEKREREKEEAHQREIEKSYRKLDEMHDILAASKIGTWRISLLNGRAPSMKADTLMMEILGIEGQNLTPEEIYNAWFLNVTPGALNTVLTCVENLKNGIRDEITYLWRHPVKGERYVCCGGNGRKTADGFVLSGYHYDIDDIVREKQRSDDAIKEHAEVISSLSTIYSTIFRVELDTHKYEVLTSVELMGNVAGTKGNFDDVKDSVLETFIIPEMREQMAVFLDFDTLAERLKATNTVATEYKNPAGRWFQARVIVKHRDASGIAREVLYVARDFTDEKEKELDQQNQLAQALTAARQANKAKSVFLNSMSHDIRTPMNAIIGFTALAQAHIDSCTQVQDYLGKISTSSEHLLSLINDVLDMSRIESGAVKLDEKPTHIPDILQDLRTMIQGLVNSKNQNLYIDTQDVIHEDVITDKLRLNQVLINIVGNAVKFTPAGGDIIIRLIEKPCRIKDRITYEFSVRDTGIGMSEEFLEHIFDVFSREQSTTVSGVQGSGLGMAITKNIVDMMGGQIKVKSKEGEGSTFFVILDLRLAEEPVKSEHPETTDGGQHKAEEKIKYDYSGIKALLAEDNELNCEIATAILEETGMTVDSVNDGDAAVSAISEAPADRYDLVFMDIQMPRMDGYTATREIRKLSDDKKANIPIIAMTANAFEEDRQMAYRSGMNGHVIKPLNITDIAQAVDAVFAEKK